MNNSIIYFKILELNYIKKDGVTAALVVLLPHASGVFSKLRGR
jgi:hypothetical protein